MTLKVIPLLQAFSSAIRRTFVQYFTRFQLTARRAVPQRQLGFSWDMTSNGNVVHCKLQPFIVCLFLADKYQPEVDRILYHSRMVYIVAKCNSAEDICLQASRGYAQCCPPDPRPFVPGGRTFAMSSPSDICPTPSFRYRCGLLSHSFDVLVYSWSRSLWAVAKLLVYLFKLQLAMGILVGYSNA